VSLAGDAVGAGHGDGYSYSFDDDDENHAVEDDEDDEDKDDGDTDTDTDDDDDDDEDDDDDDEDDDDDDDDTDTDDDYDDDEEDDDDEDDEVDEDDISEDLLNEVCEGLVLTDMDCAVSGGTPHATHDPASNVVTSSKTTRRSEAKSAKAKAEARAKAKGKARKKGKEKATKQVALSPAAIAAAASAAAAVSMSTSIASSAQLTRADRERREAERAERRKTTLTVQVAVLDVGDVFGDDCLRKHSENSYGVVALDDTEVLILNVKEVLENFKPRCNHWERLIALTSEFHQDDQTLLKQHEKSLRRRLAIKRIVSSSVSPIYARLANKERKRRREQHQNQEATQRLSQQTPSPSKASAKLNNPGLSLAGPNKPTAAVGDIPKSRVQQPKSRVQRYTTTSASIHLAETKKAARRAAPGTLLAQLNPVAGLNRSPTGPALERKVAESTPFVAVQMRSAQALRHSEVSSGTPAVGANGDKKDKPSGLRRASVRNDKWGATNVMRRNSSTMGTGAISSARKASIASALLPCNRP
jgi:CRP-like cAMP-binding protein